MIKKPDQRALEALASLEHDARFRDFLNWLEDSLAETTGKALTEREDVELRILQGGATDLRDILRHAAGARDAINSSR